MRRTRMSRLSTHSGVLAALAAIVIVIPVAAANGPTDTWTAKLGASGANGRVTLTTTATTGTLKLALKGLTASLAYPVRVDKGTCGAPGSVIWTAPTQTSTSSGKISRSLTVPAGKTVAIRTALAVGQVVVRVGKGTHLRCAELVGKKPTPACGHGWACVPGAEIAFVLPTGWSQEATGGSELFRASAGSKSTRFVIEDGAKVLAEAGLQVPTSIDEVAAALVASLEDPARVGFTRYLDVASRRMDLPVGPAVRVSYTSATSFILVSYQTTVSVWFHTSGRLIVLEHMTSYGEGTPGDPSVDPPGLAELLRSIQAFPASAMPPSPSAEPMTGRLELPRIGFAITLPTGWSRVIDADIESTVTGDSFLARELSSAADPKPQVGVTTVPTYEYAAGEDPQKATADDLEEFIGLLSHAVLARTVVELPAGRVVRLESVRANDGTEGGAAGISVIYVFEASTKPAMCYADPVVHLLVASASVPDVERYRAVFDEMARSFTHIPAPPGECGPASGKPWATPTITWGSPEALGDRIGDTVSDLVGWEGGFVAVGHGCPEEVESRWECQSGHHVVVWSSSTGGGWQRTVLDEKAAGLSDTRVERAFGGLVLVRETRWDSPATVLKSTDGRAWVRIGQVDPVIACLAAGPVGSSFQIDGLYRSGDSLYVTGTRCHGDDPGARVLRSDDGARWTPVKALPPSAQTHGVPIGTKGPAVRKGETDLPVPVARAGAWYVAGVGRSGSPASDGGMTWLWASPDGSRWRQLPSPAGMRPMGSLIAGWGDRVVLFTAGEDADASLQAWAGTVHGNKGP